MLVGNKVDLESRRQVTQEQVRQFLTADESMKDRIKHVETSSLTLQNVPSAFTELLNNIYERRQIIASNQISPSNGIKLVDLQVEKVKSGCCS